MKIYEDVFSYSVERLIKEGKTVFCLDKNKMTIYNLGFLTAVKFFEICEDKEGRYYCWIEEEQEELK